MNVLASINSLKEISNSTALRIFGGFLSLSLIINGIWWYERFKLADLSSEFYSRAHTCWPFLPCPVNETVFGVIPVVLILMTLMAAASMVLFFINTKLSTAYFLLLGSTLAKTFIFLTDAGLMGNYHYVHFWILIAYLFISHKEKVICVLLILIYFFAGLLKLNSEWISGAALLRPPPLPASWTPFLQVCAIILELVIVWFLLSAYKKWRILSLFGFCLFHIYSLWIVGGYYPSQMFCFLTIFPLLWYFDHAVTFKTLLEKPHYFKKNGQWLSISFLLAFVAFQSVPYFSPGDTALTGEGRLWSLNMLDAKSECIPLLYKKNKNTILEIDLQQYGFAPRVVCEPSFFLSTLRQICSDEELLQTSSQFQFTLMSKRLTDKDFIRILQMRNVCEDIKSYSIFGRNSFFILPKENKDLLFNFPLKPENLSITSKNNEKFQNEKIVQYRLNPERTGHSDSILNLKLLSAQKSELVWRRPNGNIGVHGASKSSPVVDESGVYVGGDSGWFLAYDLNGNLKWRFRVATPARGIHGTASTDQNYIYFGTYSGRIYKLDKNSGELIWVRQIGEALGASPLRVENDIYVSTEMADIPNGFLAKIDAATGALQWRTEFYGEQGHSSPVWDKENKAVIVGANNGFLSSYNSESGNLRWKIFLEKPIKSTTTLIDGLIYVTNLSDRFSVVSARDGQLVESINIGSSSMGSPTLMPKAKLLVFSTKDSGEIIGYSMQSKKIEWRLKSPQQGGMKGSGVSFLDSEGKDNILIPCELKKLCWINAKGKVLQKISAEGVISGVPWLKDNFVFFSENEPGDLVQYRLGKRL